ncbi:pre-mRNA splicing regulator USH1G [Phlebotomus argentipes]|uniref:pre-mRNA splicing regulator USH1G n=1 Tax=Phlebotomus argentipes TaxID=94469 RepID=UPI0028937AC2|nr:pre-mRNA splicing regulator USH1G [Phlebotomus argentipes]
MSSDRFHKAARDGLLDVLKEGTAKELNTRDATGMTPVHCAAFVGRLDALRLLVGRGGNPDKTDYYGNTALHIAAAKGHMQCVDFLVKFGVNLYAKDIERHNAKHLACLNNREDILIYLDTAIANLELTDRKKAKALQETAERDCVKVIAKYTKYQQRMNQENDDDVHTMPHRTSTVLRAMRKLPLGGSKRDAPATEASPQNNKANYSSHVRGTFSRSRGVQRHIPQWMRHGPKEVVDDFRVRKMDSSGKLTVSSLQGTRRGSEVLYVGTHASANGAKGERGRIRDVFEVGAISNEEDDGESPLNSYGNLSRSVSQPDFLAAVANGDDLSEEVTMQRPSGLFNRPSLGTLAFRRSVTATLSQIAPDVSSIDSNDSHKRKTQKIKPRNQFVLSDSDTDVASSSDTDDQEDGQTPLERFLLAFGLEEYYPIFEKERITLDILMILKEVDIEKLQLPLGPFRKLMNAIEERKNALSNPGAITDSRL